MAFTNEALVKVLQIIKTNGFSDKSLCMIGKTSIWVNKEDFIRLLKEMHLEPEKQGWEKTIENSTMIDSYLFFELYGMEVHALDFSDYEGADIIWDLRNDIPDELCYRFDYVLDWGVSEHVFDAAKALSNISKLVKLGGIVMHALPATGLVDHGFWSFSPIVFRDFYECNGFELEHLFFEFVMSDNKWDTSEKYEDHITLLSPDLRLFANYSSDWAKNRLNTYIKKVYSMDSVGHIALMCVARRVGCFPIKYPTQRDYLSVDPEYKQEKRIITGKELNSNDTDRASVLAENLLCLAQNGKNKKLIIFGAGNCGEHVNELMRMAGISVYAFCDNDSAKCGLRKNGVSIISFEELLQLKDDSFVIIASNIYWPDIKRQLLENGFMESDIVIFH